MTADQFTRTAVKVLATIMILLLVFHLGKLSVKPDDNYHYKIYLDGANVKVVNPSTGDTIYVEPASTNSELIKAIDKDNE